MGASEYRAGMTPEDGYRTEPAGASSAGAVRVGLVQLDVSSTESVHDRVDRVRDLVLSTAASSDVVLLPELWPTGAFDLDLGIEHAQAIDGPLVTQLSELAATAGTWLHGGSFVEAAGEDEFYNTSVVFNPDGDLVATYRKIHLFGFDTGEAALLSSGHDVVVLDTPLGRTALATCYDLRFPELFRRFVDADATAVLLTSGWPTKRINRWSLLAAARACENQLWIIGCNEVGFHGGHQLGGTSLVADPWGEVVAVADDQEQTLSIEVDPTYPAAVRGEFPVLRDRRL